jgi:hypothetical protein
MAKNQKITQKGTSVTSDETTNNADRNIALVPVADLQSISENLAAAQETMLRISQNTAASSSQRRRLLGSGVRRYGFIDKVSDIAMDNLEFAPPFFDIDEVKDLMRQIETLRNISATLLQLTRLNADLLLLSGDEGYRLALLYYNAVSVAKRRRIPGAESVFQALSLFFQRNSSTAADHPTEAQIERDVRALLKDKKSGKIVIENETPKIQKNKKIVIDETHKDKNKIEVRGDETETE